MANNDNFSTLFVLYDEVKKRYFIGKNKYVTLKKYAKLFTETEANDKIEELKEDGESIELTKIPVTGEPDNG